MKRVAEIIHVVESEREEFIQNCTNPDSETQKVLWACGVRKQQYFALNHLIFMTFEYEGKHFENDMAKMAAYLNTKGVLVEKRRKNVAPENLDSENWWAPVKKIGAVLETKPVFEDEADLEIDYLTKRDGGMYTGAAKYADIAFDEDDWSESMHI